MEGVDPKELTKSTPRVNRQFLHAYTGHKVRLVGKVKTTKPGVVILEPSDGGEISVRTTSIPLYRMGDIVEVVVQVNQDKSTTEKEQPTSFGENFDLKNYEQLVHLTHQYTELFIS
eukprot:TRINITY_DN790_c0_g1_i1.p1 TRINITY_DN790_c0_g1~~TRINITY_DN790_c0_g1_i1.p1  ORF type:complete len:116 (+),score=21.13 TRINITY_DN790_c0_g1_i1:93-440(+)